MTSRRLHTSNEGDRGIVGICVDTCAQFVDCNFEYIVTTAGIDPCVRLYSNNVRSTRPESGTTPSLRPKDISTDSKAAKSGVLTLDLLLEQTRDESTLPASVLTLYAANKGLTPCDRGVHGRR